MVVILKLKHVDEIAGGRKRFRRAWPTDCKHAFEDPNLSAYTRKTGAVLVHWQEALIREWDRRVSLARNETSLSTREQWEVDNDEAETMVSQVVGLANEGDRREVLGHDLHKRGFRKGLVQAVLDPTTTASDGRGISDQQLRWIDLLERRFTMKKRKNHSAHCPAVVCSCKP